MTKDDLIIQRIEDLKESTSKRLDSIDINLADHMQQTLLVREQNSLIQAQLIESVKQTDILSQLHSDNQVRIESLEEPRKVLRFLKSAALYIAAIAGAILTIAKVMEL